MKNEIYFCIQCIKEARCWAESVECTAITISHTFWNYETQ